jgi:hypothetical protein
MNSTPAIAILFILYLLAVAAWLIAIYRAFND